MSYAYFTDRQQIKDAGVPVAADVKLSDLQTHLDRAEQWYLVPQLGQATLDLVQASPTGALMRLVRPVLAGYAVAWFAAISQRTTTSTGTEPLPGTKDNANTEKLNQQHVAALKQNAADALELVLAYLEDNPLKFSAWHASKYCTVFPTRYFQHVEQLRAYPEADVSREAFRKAQGALLALTVQRVLPVLGPTLHQRLLTELNEPAHQAVLDLIRTALASYLVATGPGMLEAGACALQALRWQLQASPAEYPEFLDSPAYVPAESAPSTSASTFNAFY